MRAFFFQVAYFLLGLAEWVGLTYHEVNVVVFYGLVPFVAGALVDLRRRKFRFAPAWAAVCAVVALAHRHDFSAWSDAVFARSVAFLKAFSVLGWSYETASVVVCVVAPLCAFAALVLSFAKTAREREAAPRRRFSPPLALLLFRAALVPILPALAAVGGDAARPLLAVLLALGLLSDVFDGIVARRMGLSTIPLRRLDSRVDLAFWLAAAVAAWILDPVPLRREAPLLGAVLGLEAAGQLASFVRFRRGPCTHAFLSKCWGLALGVAFVALFGRMNAGPLRFALAWGVVSQLDVLLIVLLLPVWQSDIPSAWHAYRLRRGLPIRRHPLFNG